jgi:uncharacterized protein YegL
MSGLPGGPLATRPLILFWVLDVSGSMARDGKVQAMNHAVREALAALLKAAGENPHAAIQLMVLSFSSGAQWLNSQPVSIANFKWSDLTAAGDTEMGKAFFMLAEQLQVSRIGQHAFPPVVVLVSDGLASDSTAAGLQAVLDQPWGKRAVKISIGIGADADYGILEKFMDASGERPVLSAGNAADLVRYFVWASTEVVKAASQPASQVKGATVNANVPIPTPPPAATGPATAAEVW